MSMPLERFFIALPDASPAPPAADEQSISDQPGETDRDEPPYLHDIPSLPDFFLHLSCCHALTEVETYCVTRFIDLLALQIRKARTKWESTESVVVDSL